MVSSQPRQQSSSAQPSSTPQAASQPATTRESGSQNHSPMDPQKARQGQVILKTSAQRWIFFGALGLAAVLGIVIAVLA